VCYAVGAHLGPAFGSVMHWLGPIGPTTSFSADRGNTPLWVVLTDSTIVAAAVDLLSLDWGTRSNVTVAASLKLDPDMPHMTHCGGDDVLGG